MLNYISISSIALWVWFHWKPFLIWQLGLIFNGFWYSVWRIWRHTSFIFDLNKEASNRAVHFGSGTNHHQPWYPVGETPHMKVVGMFVVSLKRCKFRILLSIRVFLAKRHHIKPWRSRLGLPAKKYKNIYLICVFLILFIYSIHIIQGLSFVCVLTWSLLGIKKSLGHAQIGLL